MHLNKKQKGEYSDKKQKSKHTDKKQKSKQNWSLVIVLSLAFSLSLIPY
jgi:hypothetical protein